MKIIKILLICVLSKSLWAMDQALRKVLPNEMSEIVKSYLKEVKLVGFVRKDYSKNCDIPVYAISPDGKCLFSAFSCSIIECTDLATKDGVALVLPNDCAFTTAARAPSGILSMAFSKNGKYLVTRCLDETIKVWNIDLKTILIVIKVKNGWGTFAISSDSKYLIYSQQSETGETAVVLELEIGKILRILDHKTSVKTICISEDNKFVVTLGFDRQIYVWDFESGVLIKTFDFSEISSELPIVLFIEDNKNIIAIFKNACQLTWTLKTGDLVKKKLISDFNNVNAAQISDDKKYIIFTYEKSKEKYIKLLNRADGIIYGIDKFGMLDEIVLGSSSNSKFIVFYYNNQVFVYKYCIPEEETIESEERKEN